MRGAWIGGAVAVLVACSAMQCQSTKQRSSEPTPTETLQHTPPRPSTSSTVMLTQQLESCEAQLEAAKDDPDPVTKPAAKTHVKVVNGPPKKCADPPPVIKPVDTTNCQEGMVCLDEKAQAALARNLAAYEAWMTRVTKCENEP